MAAIHYIFPDIVLIEVFCNLSIQDLCNSALVCKHWNSLVRVDVIWKRHIPKYSWFELPPKAAKAQSVYKAVARMWKSSVKLGNERWLPNPMPELERYEKWLRKAEFHNYYKCHSTTILLLRLNPSYDFTTKGKDLENLQMNEVCQEIWKHFGGKGGPRLSMDSHEDLMKRAQYRTKKIIMKNILDILQPGWFLTGLNLEEYELDEEANIISGPALEGEAADHIEDDIGDINEQSTKDRSVFGSFVEKTAWIKKVNKPLPLSLYNKLKAFFADESGHFIEYFLNDGCFNENYQYAYHLLISDSAVFFIKQFYDL